MNVYVVYEVHLPGVEVRNPDNKRSAEITKQLEHLVEIFIEANTALNLFLETQSADPAPLSAVEVAYYKNRFKELEAEIRNELSEGNDDTFTNEYLSHEVKVRLSREKWVNGIKSEKLERKKSFMFAKSFLLAFDSFDKFLNLLKNDTDLPAGLKVAYQKFQDTFPDVKEVRNSVQHSEYRARGLGKWKKGQGCEAIPRVPGVNGRVLMSNVLWGNTYMCTKGDGHIGKVEISMETLEQLQDILHEVLNYFEWEGPKRFEPSS